MQTYSEMQTELLARLMASTNSTLFPTARIQTLIKDAHLWATSLYLWPQLERDKYTSTNGDYYYDYPTDFRTDSISRIIIDDKEYDRKAFEDWLDYKLNNSTDTNTRIFADFGRQIFIFPTPGTGTDNFDIWGSIQATQLSASGDKTIFSDHDDSGNEAIVKKALSVAIAKIDKKLSQAEESEATNILSRIFRKVLQRQQRDQRKDHPQFDIPNYYGKQVGEIGKFSI